MINTHFNRLFVKSDLTKEAQIILQREVELWIKSNLIYSVVRLTELVSDVFKQLPKNRYYLAMSYNLEKLTGVLYAIIMILCVCMPLNDLCMHQQCVLLYVHVYTGIYQHIGLSVYDNLL